MQNLPWGFAWGAGQGASFWRGLAWEVWSHSCVFVVHEEMGWWDWKQDHVTDRGRCKYLDVCGIISSRLVVVDKFYQLCRVICCSSIFSCWSSNPPSLLSSTRHPSTLTTKAEEVASATKRCHVYMLTLIRWTGLSYSHLLTCISEYLWCLTMVVITCNSQERQTYCETKLRRVTSSGVGLDRWPLKPFGELQAANAKSTKQREVEAGYSWC